MKKNLTAFITVILLTITTFSVAQNASTVNVSGTTATQNISNNVAMVVDANLVITSDGNITGFTAMITGSYTSGDILDYTGALPSGITAGSFNTTRRSLQFSGTTSAANWQALLRTVRIKTTSATCYQEQRQVSFIAGSKFYNNLNGHFYEVSSTSTTWQTGFANAAAQSYFGRQGYMVTITSQAENSFVSKILGNNCWFGATDDYTYINAALGNNFFFGQGSTNSLTALPSAGGLSEGKWYWVCGPEKGLNFSNGDLTPLTTTGNYANWQSPPEPNNSGGSGEHYGEIYVFDGTWNDLPAFSTFPTVIEYGGLSTDNEGANVVFTSNLLITGAPGGTITGGITTVCNGANNTTLTLTGLASGGSVIKWQYSYDDFLTNGIDIAGSASTTYTANNISQNTYYRAVVNAGGCFGLNTSSTRVYVNKAVAGNIFADNNTICNGSNVNFILNGYSGAVTKWQVSTSSTFASNVTDITNTTAALSYTLNTVGTYYFRAVINSCSNTVYTSGYTISVVAGSAPVGGTVSSVSLCGTSSGSLTLSGSTGTVSKWQYSTDGGVVWIDVANITTTLSFSSVTTNRKYRAFVTNGSCGTAISAEGTISVSASTGITIGSVSSVSTTATSFTLPYSATTGSPNQYSISTGSPTVLNGFTAITNASLPVSPISVTIPASAAGIYNFNISVTNSITGCASANTPFTVTVESPASITTTGTLTAFTTCFGTASTVQNFTVSGTSLTANLVVTAPLGYEVSLTAGSGYASSVTLTPASGTVANTTIFVRLATTATGTPAGNITVASIGATTQNVAATGTLTSVVTTNTITASQTICSGSTPNSLTGSTPTGGDGTTYTYAWQSSTTSATAGFSAALNTNTSINYQPTALTQTTWFRRVVTSGACASDNSAAVIITVNPLPSATIAGTSAVCQNASAPIITFTGSLGTAPYTFSYTINGGSVQTVTTTSGNAVTVSAPTANAGGFIYALVSVRDASSSSCSNTVTGSATITINSLPTIAAITGATNPVCAGSTINLSSTTIGGVWSSSDIALATINSVSGIVTGVATGIPNILYTVTNSNGCINVVSSQITVNSLPALTTISGPSTVCESNTINQTNTIIGGIWSSGSSAIATVNNAGVVTGVSAGTVAINYLVTNTNNCSVTNTKNITVLSQPARTPIIKDTLICKATNFTVNATIPSSATYAWTASAGGFTSITPIINITNPAMYRLQITLSNGCFYIDSINLRNTADTAIRAKLLVSSQGFINDNIVAVNLTSPTPQSAVWSVPAGAQVVSQTTTNLILKFANTGRYLIGLNAKSLNVCSSIDSGIVIISNRDLVTNTTSNNQVIREVNVGPNPSNGVYNFNIKLNKASDVSIRVFNTTTGILVNTTVIPLAVGVTTINKQVDISNFQRNTYVAVIQTKDSYEVRTLIKN